ncbi:hypothetical protein [Palleronia rufa]|uniref:hypothetical protein n=1 Tax=Palleronia rufa TaxID=1530186 RepID=UPI00055FD495|nr:hypothetical protein [Palleronia rufa]
MFKFRKLQMYIHAPETAGGVDYSDYRRCAEPAWCDMPQPHPRDLPAAKSRLPHYAVPFDVL